MPSALPPVTPSGDPGCFTCDLSRCVVCDSHLVQTDTFHSMVTSETFHIRHHMTCQTSNLVYLLFCNKCPNSQYVGETQNTLKQRFYLHRSNINQNTGTHVTRHFNQADHSLANLRCITIEKQKSDSREQRLKREDFWKYKLKTIFPNGPNTPNH